MNQHADIKPFKIYRASAGSGKTYTLVREYLSLCFKSSSDDAYKEILAVTFTNKAANEMKNKILYYLRGIMNGKKDCENLKKDLIKETCIEEAVIIEKSRTLYTHIIHNYSDFNVSTIDSFVQHLSRSFAKELGLPNQYSVFLDDDDLIDEVLQRIGNEISKDNNYLTDLLTEFLEFQLSEENSWRIEIPIRTFIKKLLKETAYKKGDYLNVNTIDKQQYDETNTFLNKNIKSIEKSFDDYVNEIENIENQYDIDISHFSYKEKGLPSIKKVLKERKMSGFSKTALDILNGNKKWYSAEAKKSRFEIDIDAVGQILIQKYSQAIDYYQDNMSRYYVFKSIRKNLYLYALRTYIMEIINQYIAESSQVHISEFNKRISDVIGNCSVPFIYERIGEKYIHYFIDEFQDTSVLQWQNFLPLIYNSLSNGNMNLLVGDAKQSIYRFRSGEVEQIISLPNIYQKPDYQDINSIEYTFSESYQNPALKFNYRSAKNIINFNNTFFANVKNCFDSEYQKFHDVYNDVNQEISPFCKNDGFVSVEIFQTEKFKDGEKRGWNKQKYRESVENRMLNQIADLLALGYKYKDITILIRSNKDGSDIANLLNDNKIPVISADSILLKSSDKVQLIIQTLKYFHQNDNPVIIATLLYYKNKCQKDNALELSDLFESLDDLSKNFISDKAIIDVRDKAVSLYDMCVSLMKVFDFHIVDDIFLQYFMNLIQEWQNGKNSGLAGFLDYWDKKENEFSLKVTGDIDAIQIMTIHKAKGLEFNIVFYPFAFTKFPNKSLTQNELWLNCKDFPETADIPNLEMYLLPIKSDLEKTHFSYLYENEYNKTKLDDLNIMYVAMTRPVNMLFVYSNDESTKETENIFNKFFKEHPEYEKKASQDELSDIFNIGVCEFYPEKSKISDTMTLKLTENEEVPKTADWMSILKVEADPSMFWAENEYFMPQEWGTLVHDILSNIKTLDDAQKAVAPYINDGTLDESKAEQLIDKFKKIMVLPEISKAYDKNAIVKNEVDILSTDGSILRPDRYAEIDGDIILIDYKTGRLDEKHHEQLRSYMIALQNMTDNMNIKAYLVYIGQKIKVIEVFLDRLF